MLRLTKTQYAQLARSAEHILKKAKDNMQGSGPDDYGAPDMLETYLYRHPMGMLEFWVDDGGIAGGGFKSSFRKLMKSVGKRIGMVSKHAKSRAKAHLEDCPLYTSDAAADLLCLALGGRRTINKKKKVHTKTHEQSNT